MHCGIKLTLQLIGWLHLSLLQRSSLDTFDFQSNTFQSRLTASSTCRMMYVCVLYFRPQDSGNVIARSDQHTYVRDSLNLLSTNGYIDYTLKQRKTHIQTMNHTPSGSFSLRRLLYSQPSNEQPSHGPLVFSSLKTAVLSESIL